MAYLEKNTELWQELAGLAEDDDLRLYDAERQGDNGLRITIARESGNVTSDDCTRFCKRLMVHFSVEGQKFGLSEEPRLEVASPGVNRSLRTHDHFVGAVGERIKLVWQPEPKKTNTTIGMLSEVQDDIALSVVDEASGESHIVPMEQVKKARVDFPF